MAGEAAGLAMGLLSIGAAESSADAHGAEMLAYAHDTAHEKIIRGLAVGLALLCYGREEAADALLEQLTTDQACPHLVHAAALFWFFDRVLQCTLEYSFYPADSPRHFTRPC